jgi:hypothetical protein
MLDFPISVFAASDRAASREWMGLSSVAKPAEIIWWESSDFTSVRLIDGHGIGFSLLGAEDNSFAQTAYSISAASEIQYSP